MKPYYPALIKEVADELGLPAKLVSRTYLAYWRAIHEYITSLPLKEELNDEEFSQLRPNVNIPSLGKLNVTLERYHRVKRKLREDIARQEENKKKNKTV